MLRAEGMKHETAAFQIKQEKGTFSGPRVKSKLGLIDKSVFPPRNVSVRKTF